jgi:hypothetical protein
MSHRSRNRIAALFAAVFLLGPGLALAGEATGSADAYWPSEVESQLHQVENQLLDVQLKRAVARQQGKTEEAEKLDEQYKKLEKEQFTLLRKSGQLE